LKNHAGEKENELGKLKGRVKGANKTTQAVKARKLRILVV